MNLLRFISPFPRASRREATLSAPGRGAGWRLGACLVLLPWWGLGASFATVAAPEPQPVTTNPDEEEDLKRERAIKAALILKFARYVEWPKSKFESRKSPIIVAVVGTDPFGSILERTFQGKKLGSRPYVVKRFTDPEKIDPCHILFVSESEKWDLELVLEQTRGQSVLLIGSSPRFARRGGMINFYREKVRDENGDEVVRLRFEINPDEVTAEKLKVNSALLRLARIVKKKKDK